MARVGITYLEVAHAADELLARGQEPSIRLVRAELGETGSPNTIQRHLAAWREARPAVTAAVAELSPTTTAAIASEIAQAAARARAEVEGQLLQARAEAFELAGVGEQLEKEREELQARLVEVTTDRDQRLAVNDLQAQELDDLREAFDKEVAAAEAARMAAAKAELRLEMSAADKEEIAKLREQVRELSDRVVFAERALAVSRAEVDAGSAAHLVAQRQITGLQEQLAAAVEVKNKDGIQYQAEIKALRTELGEIGSELSQARVAEAAAAGRLQAMLEAQAKAERLEAEAKAKAEKLEEAARAAAAVQGKR